MTPETWIQQEFRSRPAEAPLSLRKRSATDGLPGWGLKLLLTESNKEERKANLRNLTKYS